jgi:GNAT superfamily N-acetyltransferase
VRRDELIIRPARAGEGERLREVAIASKLHWGYDQERVYEWANGGDYSDDALARIDVYVAELGGCVVAWGGVERKDEELCWLTDLWVVPESIGKGVGTALFARCTDRARELGTRRLAWEAEPNSVGFYEKVGARRTGAESLSSWGRPVPVMEIEL